VALEAVDLDPATRLVFYRFAQEGLSNVTKHSNATAVAITLTNGNSVELRVSDNGCGFDPSAVPAGHLGLTIMRERAEAVGARLSIDTSPGSGTDLRLSVAE
jgi:signal transduction histidine kinase